MWADREHEPDLFWAIRGGGGELGIVTALEFALYPVQTVYGGAMFWPMARSREILCAWRAWTEGLPEELTSIARVRRMPLRPHVPERLRGRSFAIVEAAYIGAEADATDLLRPLRSLDPEIDTIQTRPMTELGPLHLDPRSRCQGSPTAASSQTSRQAQSTLCSLPRRRGQDRRSPPSR